MKLSHTDYCDLYANRCNLCKGKKYIDMFGVHTLCSCQKKATIKFRFEQIDICPSELKYKEWHDFTGLITNGSQTIGALDASSAIQARNQAMSYCFDSCDLNVTKDRKRHLIIHNHIYDGKSIIISGDKCSGKTLLSSLILKEVAWASLIHGLDLQFRFVKSIDIIQSARWSNDKDIDYNFLNDLMSVHFLAIDSADNFFKYGHTGPPDNIVMNSFFSHRRSHNLPVILVCSPKFLSMLDNPSLHTDVKHIWGDEFLLLMTSSGNVKINIVKK